MTEDAGCDVAPIRDWGHDSTDSLVERVRRGIISTWTSDEDANKSGFRDAIAALTELAERLKAAEAKWYAAVAQRDELVEALERISDVRLPTGNAAGRDELRGCHQARRAMQDIARAALAKVRG